MKAAFWARVPLANEPSSAVTVWGAASAFVQVTDEPRPTVSVVGANAKSTIAAATTALDVGAGVAVGVAVGRGVLVGVGAGVVVGRGVAMGLAALVDVGVGVRVGGGVAGDRVGEAEGAVAYSSAVPSGTAEAVSGVADAVAGGLVAADAAGVGDAVGEPSVGAPVAAAGADVPALGEQAAKNVPAAIAATATAIARRTVCRDLSMRCPTLRRAPRISLPEGSARGAVPGHEEGPPRVDGPSVPEPGPVRSGRRSEPASFVC